MKKLYSTLFALLAIAASASAADVEKTIYSSDMTNWTVENDGGTTNWVKWSALGFGVKLTDAQKTLTGCDDGIACNTEDADSWAVSPAIDLKADVAYIISFYLEVPDTDSAEDSDYNPEYVTLTVANDGALASIKVGKQLFSDSDFQSRDLVKEEVEFTPTVDGSYHFGLNAKSQSDDWGIYTSYAIGATGFSVTESGSAACATIAADSASAPEYYDLRGIRVSRPAAGQVCIMRSGSEVKKVVIR